MSGPPLFNVFDGDGGSNVPRRPSLDDLGGAAYEDDQQYPPDPLTMPSAAMENQNEMVLYGLAKMGATALVYVKFTGGTPAIDTLVSPGNLLEIADFTITDNGDGDTSVVVAANKIPAMLPFNIAQPIPTGTGVWSANGRSISLGWRVETYNGITAADCDFLLVFF